MPIQRNKHKPRNLQSKSPSQSIRRKAGARGKKSSTASHARQLPARAHPSLRQRGAWPSHRTVAAIVCASNEADAIGAVIAELEKLPFHEIIVVINGSTDATFDIVRRSVRCTIVHYSEPLGHDVGRAAGAMLAESDILLFVDGDFPVPAKQLTRFVRAVAEGADIALNDISRWLGTFRHHDAVTVMKQFLNRVIRRPELKANSLTAVPHAMSRRAMETIGVSQLAVPPKAQAVAAAHQLRITAPASVNVLRKNRLRSSNQGRNNTVASMIVGDHLEAIRWVQRASNARLHYHDAVRDRGKVREAGT